MKIFRVGLYFTNDCSPFLTGSQDKKTEMTKSRSGHLCTCTEQRINVRRLSIHNAAPIPTARHAYSAQKLI